MKNNIALWVVVIVAVGLSVYASFFKKTIRQEIYPTTTIQAPAPPVVQRTTMSYSTVSADNATITNKLMLTPVLGGVNTSYPKTNGQVWYDANDGSLRFWDGNTNQGTKFALGKYSEDSVHFSITADDSASFTPLVDDIAWVVNYTLRVDTLTGTGATFTFKEINHPDSTYVSMDENLFPYTLAVGTKEFCSVAASKYQKLVVNKGSATKIVLTMTRKIKIGQ